MRAVLLFACLLLAGCGAASLQPIRTPVPVECRVRAPARPVMPTERLQVGVELDPYVAATQAEIEIREGYEGELREALAICTAPIALP